MASEQGDIPTPTPPPLSDPPANAPETQSEPESQLAPVARQFTAPIKRITNPTELTAFHRSNSFRSLIGYIQSLCEAAEGKINIHEGGSEVCGSYSFSFRIPIFRKRIIYYKIVIYNIYNKYN